MSSPASLDSSALWLAACLQTSDAAFPTGAYAHSLGFEECVRLGQVHSEETLLEFVHSHTLPALRTFELPFLQAAMVAAAAGDLEELTRLDALIGAAKLAGETRSASAQLGARRLRSLCAVVDHPVLVALEQRVQSGGCAPHHLIVCGAQAVAVGLPVEAASIAYIYQSISSVCTAALKLIRIGQEGCQRVLTAALRETPAILAGARAATITEAGWFDPALEIASMRHAVADERLFIS